jgi:hypothetical protein
MLTDAAAPVLVTRKALLDQLPPYGARIVRLDRDASANHGPARECACHQPCAPEQRLRLRHVGLDRNPQSRGGFA